MKIRYDKTANAAYIYLAAVKQGTQAARTYSCDPYAVNGEINLDFNAAGQLIGIEILDASRLLAKEILSE